MNIRKLPPQPVAVGEVQGHHFLELFQLPRGRVGVVAIALQLCHQLALIGYIALNFGKLSLGGRRAARLLQCALPG